MNIQNIVALAGQLESLGFENPGSSLLKRICFKPASFSVNQKIKKGKDGIHFQLFFERDLNQGVYTLRCYDAMLQKEIVIPEAIINGVDISFVENNMASIDWGNAFKPDEGKSRDINSKDAWDQEQKIETIVDDLQLLEETEEGETIAQKLRCKYWADVNTALFEDVGQLKQKAEVTQRFYFLPGQDGISVDEAYRFLQNQWLQKQIQYNRKQNQVKEGADNWNSESDHLLSGLPKKVPAAKLKSFKSNKVQK